jgi:hypothetical protein
MQLLDSENQQRKRRKKGGVSVFGFLVVEFFLGRQKQVSKKRRRARLVKGMGVFLKRARALATAAFLV